MRAIRSLALSLGLVLVLAPAAQGGAAAPIEDQPVGSISGPSVQVRPDRARPGEQVQLSISGFSSPWVVASFCGNNALNGSADCNMSESEGNEIDPSATTSRFTMPVAAPPSDCPCVLLVVGADQSETARVPFEVIGHPVGDLVTAPTLEGQVDVSIEATPASQGLWSTLSAALGGATTYELVVLVRNRSGEPLSAVTAKGAGLDSDGRDMVTFDFGAAPPIAPGQTWRSSTQAIVPAPAIHEVTWQVDVIGAGPTLQATTSSEPQLWLLLLLLAVAVVSVSVVAGRRIIRRRVRNSDEGSDDQPSSPEVERQGEPVAEVVMSASSGSPM
jgi:hypothetical protein